MNTLQIEILDIAASSVRVSDLDLAVHLTDGRTIAVHVAWFPRLADGSEAERANWRLIAHGNGIHWPDLDEDVSVESLLNGRRSRESDSSLNGLKVGIRPYQGNEILRRTADSVVFVSTTIRLIGPAGFAAAARRSA